MLMFIFVIIWLICGLMGFFKFRSLVVVSIEDEEFAANIKTPMFFIGSLAQGPMTLLVYYYLKRDIDTIDRVLGAIIGSSGAVINELEETERLIKEKEANP